jgi:hypothetical protein
MARHRLPTEWEPWIDAMTRLLDARLAGRLRTVFEGWLFADGRRTAASWWRAAGVGAAFRLFYYFLGSLGRGVEHLAWVVLRYVIEVVVPGDRILLALDDTPTKRYGPLVEGAGLHRNPTPGPAGSKFVYGHIWVTLAWLAEHPWWGVVALPLRAMLYVRQCDISALPRRYGVQFQTKLEQAATLLCWVTGWLRRLEKRVWLAVDGAYAKRPLLQAARQTEVVVASRLRHDAQLWSVPKPPPKGAPVRRGRKRKYGTERIHLRQRAAHPRGWQAGEFQLYGKTETRRYKTFEATYKPAGGRIRVVIVKDAGSWRSYFCTDPAASVAEILEAVADRGAIEQTFHDLKEVDGAGQQQLRNYWANLAAYHVNLWMYTLIELWAWRKPARQLVDRRDRPWDRADRRPSHADRRKALRRQCLTEELKRLAPATRTATQLRQFITFLLKRAG